MLLQDLKLTFGAGYRNSSFTFKEEIALFLHLVLRPTKDQNRFLLPSKSWFAFSTTLFHMSSFFSITNCFTSLRNLHYSVHNSLSPLYRNLLYTSCLCLSLPLIPLSHQLVDLPQTTVFSPITSLVIFVTRSSHALSTS